MSVLFIEHMSSIQKHRIHTHSPRCYGESDFKGSGWWCHLSPLSSETHANKKYISNIVWFLLSGVSEREVRPKTSAFFVFCFVFLKGAQSNVRHSFPDVLWRRATQNTEIEKGCDSFQADFQRITVYVLIRALYSHMMLKRMWCPCKHLKEPLS